MSHRWNRGIQRSEAKGHAIVLAAVLWIGAGVLHFGAPGPEDLFGRVEGPDFVHFYTLGRIVHLGEPARLYDARALHDYQTAIVPASASEHFVPVYPPQTAIIFAAVAGLPYRGALAVWSGITGIVYGLAVALAWRRFRGALPDAIFVTAAALAFPPFWNLVLHGQTTPIVLLAFVGGWMALERGWPFLAGVVLSLVAIKPQLGLVLAAVVIAGFEWRMLFGAVVGVGVQALLVAAVLGPGILATYVSVVGRFAEIADALEPRPYQLHSIRALFGPLPGPVDTGLWLAASAAVIWLAVWAWRSSGPVAVRFAVVIIASVLVSPHLTIYDASVLAPALLLAGGWLLQSSSLEASRFWQGVYWLFVCYLVPIALLTGFQPSVLVLAWLLWLVFAALRSATASPAISP